MKINKRISPVACSSVNTYLAKSRAYKRGAKMQKMKLIKMKNNKVYRIEKITKKGLNIAYVLANSLEQAQQKAKQLLPDMWIDIEAVK